MLTLIDYTLLQHGCFPVAVRSGHRAPGMHAWLVSVFSSLKGRQPQECLYHSFYSFWVGKPGTVRNVTVNRLLTLKKTSRNERKRKRNYPAMRCSLFWPESSSGKMKTFYLPFCMPEGIPVPYRSRNSSHTHTLLSINTLTAPSKPHMEIILTPPFMYDCPRSELLAPFLK